MAIEADSEEELMNSCMNHAVSVHGFPDTDETRATVKGLFQPVVNA